VRRLYVRKKFAWDIRALKEVLASYHLLRRTSAMSKAMVLTPHAEVIKWRSHLHDRMEKYEKSGVLDTFDNDQQCRARLNVMSRIMTWRNWREAWQAMCQISDIWEEEDVWEGVVRYQMKLGQTSSVAQLQFVSINTFGLLPSVPEHSECRQSAIQLVMSEREAVYFRNITW